MDHAAGWLADRLGVAFSDPGLLALALTHRSHGSANNERLEYLGDAVLSFVVAELLFRRFPAASEGELSRYRASLVSGEALAAIAAGLGLGEQIRLGEGELKSGGQRRATILADALEAVFGALYLDQGLGAAREHGRSAQLRDCLVELSDVIAEQGDTRRAYDLAREALG
jgi:ribonuclease-3